jgi:hypothetical protein
MTQNEQNDIFAEIEDAHGQTSPDVKPRTGGWVNLPEGTAILKVDNVFVKKTQNGKKQLTAACKVVSHDQTDEYNGETVFKNWMLETEQNLEFLYGDCVKLDIDPPAPDKKFVDELKRVMENLQDVTFKVAVVENKDPQYGPNMYINDGALVNEDDIPKGNNEESIL